MARPFTDSWLSELCAHFGLKVRELAQYLGTDTPQLSRQGTGQRPTSPTVAEGLGPFVAALQAAEALPAAPLALAPPAFKPLEARLDYCQHHARRLRRALRPLETQARQAGSWAVALPTLRAALPAAPSAEPDEVVDWPAWLNWYRHRWLTRRPTALPAALSAQYHLLRLRAEALETEAAALRALLEAGGV